MNFASSSSRENRRLTLVMSSGSWSSRSRLETSSRAACAVGRAAEARVSRSTLFATPKIQRRNSPFAGSNESNFSYARQQTSCTRSSMSTNPRSARRTRKEAHATSVGATSAYSLPKLPRSGRAGVAPSVVMRRQGTRRHVLGGRLSGRTGRSQVQFRGP